MDICHLLKTKGESVGAHMGEVLILGVSVNAYVAAELASKWDGIMDLCLLMPGIDLFDSLDNLLREVRATELLTRRFYLAKKGFRANELSDGVTFFGDAHMSVYCFLDLLKRGAKCCDVSFLKTNLLNVIEKGGRICFGHSKQDSMTPWAEVEDISEDIGLKNLLWEISWRHDLHSGVRYIEQIGDGHRNGNRDAGIDAIVKNLIDVYARTVDEEIVNAPKHSESKQPHQSSKRATLRIRTDI